MKDLRREIPELSRVGSNFHDESRRDASNEFSINFEREAMFQVILREINVIARYISVTNN